MKRRFIFDLDHTLLSGDFSHTDQYFIDKFGEDSKLLLKRIGPLNQKYNRMFRRYDYNDYSKFLIEATGLDITPQDVKNWDELSYSMEDTMEPNVIEVLEYIKSIDGSSAVSSNWFRDTQIYRLKRAGILDYFDGVFAGDVICKPHKEAYWMAAAQYALEECVFIGDNVDTDYIGPKSCGMDAVLYDKNDRHHKTLIKVRNLIELKDMYK